MAKKKNEILDDFSGDLDKCRGAALEIMSANRALNEELVQQMIGGDFSLLEEYNILTKSILDSMKILTDIHAQTPKIIKDIDNLEEKKEKINLQDLIKED